MRSNRLVIARQLHRCWDCERLIVTGERHLVSSLTPGHEFGHPTRWTHGRFCRACCERYTYERELWQEAEAAA